MTIEALNFTEGERKGVEDYYGTPWDELTDAGKVLRGLVYRHTLSPKAISDYIMNGDKHEVQHKRDGVEQQDS
jgi:hypothetical protein